MGRITTNVRVKTVLGLEHLRNRDGVFESRIYFRDHNGVYNSVTVSGHVLSAEVGEFNDRLVYDIKE